MIDEMTSTGGINVIQIQVIRQKIIKMYNTYNVFKEGVQASYEHNRLELRKLAFKIPFVYDHEIFNNVPKPELIKALKNHELKNRVLANHAVGLNRELTALQKENRELLKHLNAYLFKL